MKCERFTYYYLISMRNELVRNFTCKALVYETHISHMRWKIHIWKLISHKNFLSRMELIQFAYVKLCMKFFEGMIFLTILRSVLWGFAWSKKFISYNLSLLPCTFVFKKLLSFHPVRPGRLQSIIHNYRIRLSHDIKNYSDLCQCYQPKPKASADNIDRGLDNSWYHVKAESNNCFIIQLWIEEDSAMTILAAKKSLSD